ncbi:uncharacterized protein LOC117645686 [Thrips palmi]|uniref:Uncharacterized protein LOC117645686 n=1 Tax=Thrips palmi TaxID=161013 RepID=A0A6P8Z5J8_THRPL|nr:uncharacterized protein LOC117645686 [Thrips palmi]
MPNNRHHFLWRILIGNRVSPPLAAWLALWIFGGALQEETAPKMSSGIRMAITFIPIVHSLVFWLSRLHKEDLLNQLEEVARTLEPYSEPHRRELEGARRYSATALWMCKAYALADVCTLIVPLCLNQDKLDLNIWPWPPGRMWVIIGGSMICCMGVPFAFPTFVGLAYYMSFLAFEIALHGVLGDAVRHADTPAKVLEVAKMDVRLTEVGIRQKNAMAGFTATFLALMLVTPLISTVLAFLGQFDLFTIASIPYVIMFITLCYIGQDIQDSCVRVATAAYDCAWTEVPDSSSRATVLMMMTRRGRPLSISAKLGVGALNLSVCRETMHSWYSLLQLLLKLF